MDKWQAGESGVKTARNVCNSDNCHIIDISKMDARAECINVMQFDALNQRAVYEQPVQVTYGYLNIK